MIDMSDSYPDFLIAPLICWTEIDHRHKRTYACKHYDLSSERPDPDPYYLSINIHTPSEKPGGLSSYLFDYYNISKGANSDPVSDEQEDDLDSYLLNYYDKSGEWITDTWHETLEKAFSQAEFEFTNSRKTWKNEEGDSLFVDKDSPVYHALCRASTFKS